MNIRTFDDYRRPQSPQYEPLNEHGDQRSQSNTQGTQQISDEDQFWSYNLEPGQQPQPYHIFLLCFCPCLIGNQCSPARRGDYIRLLLSFIFWVSIVDIIYFIVTVSVGGFTSPALNPALGPDSDTLYRMGAKSAYAIKVKYEVYRLFSPIFMHAGVFHLLINLLAQLSIGLGYERCWSPLRVVPIYLISGVAGNLFSCCVIFVNDISVGASGAIMGLIGAKLSSLVCRWNKISPSDRAAQIVSVLFTILIVMLWSFSRYIDWASHLGGLMMGVILGFLLFSNHIESKALKVITVVTSILAFVSFFVTLSTVFALVVDAK
ncbi:rhomboid-like protease [Acrasis kona]|uniref:rhomboid protease n=1 Tax=Acrasis kona TaxID=1008807 RepID=A0AAW2ZLR7_9EUKA